MGFTLCRLAQPGGGGLEGRTAKNHFSKGFTALNPSLSNNKSQNTIRAIEVLCRLIPYTQSMQLELLIKGDF